MVALGAPLASLVAGADSAMVTLSKGLCAPAGSVLVSSRARVDLFSRHRAGARGKLRKLLALPAATGR